MGDGGFTVPFPEKASRSSVVLLFMEFYMVDMARKKVIFGLILLLIVSAFVINYFGTSNKLVDGLSVELNSRQNINTDKQIRDNPIVVTEQNSSIDGARSGLPVQDRAEVLSVYGSYQEEAEVKKWCSARGAKCALEQQDEKIYESYDIATLESLSNNGDVRAMTHLAERYAKDFIDKGEPDKGFELRNQLYFKAASYGSTDALLKLGLAANTGTLKSRFQGRELALEALAYYEVAAIRGDRFGKVLLGSLPVRENELALTDADYAYIETRAEEIYQGLQHKRHELGLGEFDNEVPESVTRYFDRIE